MYETANNDEIFWTDGKGKAKWDAGIMDMKLLSQRIDVIDNLNKKWTIILVYKNMENKTIGRVSR